MIGGPRATSQRLCSCATSSSRHTALKQPDMLASASPEQPQGSLLGFAAACELEDFAIVRLFFGQQRRAARDLHNDSRTSSYSTCFPRCMNATFRRLFGLLCACFRNSAISTTDVIPCATSRLPSSDLHTPAVYFIPPVWQKEELFGMLWRTRPPPHQKQRTRQSHRGGAQIIQRGAESGRVHSPARAGRG